MYIIVGLGNPEAKYDNTRHNTGFMAIDRLAKRWNISVSDEKFKALLGKGMIEGNKVLLVKPLTYMNLSGEALSQIVAYYKEDPETNVIVLYDDISLPVGQLRIRPKGSAGGHNGIKNIIKMLSTEKFLRIKIGVGEKPPKMDLADYVLGHFNDEEKREMEAAWDSCIEAVSFLMNEGVDKAMNKYNTKV